MKRLQGLIVSLAFVATAAWGQAPATQPSSATTVSGCMTQSFGHFVVSDQATSKSWEVKGTGTGLWNLENHIVKVQGLPDPKSPTPVLYAQNVQDAGSTCGNAPAAAASSTNPAATPSVAPPATQPSGFGQEEQPGGGVEQNQVTPSQPTAPQSAEAAPSNQQGSAPAATTPTVAPPGENRATPNAASLQSDAAPANAGQQPQAADNSIAIFNGCLNGSVNNYQFKANGKTYRLQGNTTALNAMLNHQVEITGEDFNGKAIQVNGARDLGSICKGK